MKATGIVRRVDELGRIVIPKEIRSTMHLFQGNPLEIFLGEEGEIVLKKYSMASEIKGIAQAYADALAKTYSALVLITDRECFIAAGGKGKKDFLEKHIGKGIELFLEDRIRLGFDGKKKGREKLLPLYDGDETDWEDILAIPMIQAGDVIGGLIFCREPGMKEFHEVEEKGLICAEHFFENQKEI